MNIFFWIMMDYEKKVVISVSLHDKYKLFISHVKLFFYSFLMLFNTMSLFRKNDQNEENLRVQIQSILWLNLGHIKLVLNALLIKFLWYRV